MHFVHKNGNDIVVLGLFLTLGQTNFEVQRFLDIACRQCIGEINL